MIRSLYPIIVVVLLHMYSSEAQTVYSCSGGTLPASVNYDTVTATNCNVPSATAGSTLVLYSRSASDASGFSKMTLQGGTVPAGSILVIQGGASAAAMATSAPTSVLFSGYTFTESLISVTGFFAPGSVVTVSGCSLSRTTPHPHSVYSANSNGYLVAYDGYTLMAGAKLIFQGNNMYSNYNGPMIFMMVSGDANLLADAALIIENNTMSLHGAVVYSNAHTIYQLSFSTYQSAGSSHIWRYNSISGYCHVQHIGITVSLNAATMSIYGNYFYHGPGVHLFSTFAAVAVTIIFGGSSSEVFTVSDNVFNYTEPIWPNAGGGYAVMDTASLTGSFVATNNVFIDYAPVGCTAYALYLSFTSATSFKATVTGNQFRRQTAAGMPYIYLDAHSLVTGSQVQIGGNNFSSLDTVTTRRFVDGPMVTAASTLLICDNFWYGIRVWESTVSDLMLNVTTVGALVFCGQSMCLPATGTMDCQYGTLPGTIAGAYHSHGCSTVTVGGTNITVAAVPGTAASAPVPIYLSCGAAYPNSTLEVQGGPSAAVMATKAPVDIRISGFVFLEAMLIFSGVLASGSTVTVSNTSSLRTAIKPHPRSPVYNWGVLIFISNLELLQSASITVRDSVFEDSPVGISPLFITFAGDIVIGGSASLVLTRITLLLNGAGAGYNTHAILPVIYSGPQQTRFVLVEPTSLFEFSNSHLTATCQVGFLLLNFDIGRGTAAIVNNTFVYNNSTLTSGGNIVLASLIPYHREAGQGLVDFSYNRLVFMSPAPPAPGSGGYIQYLPMTAVCGTARIVGNSLVDAMSSSSASVMPPLRVSLKNSTSLRLTIAGNNFTRAFAPDVPFIQFLDSSVGSGTLVIVVNNSVSSALVSPTRQLAAATGTPLSAPAGTFFFCDNYWYGQHVTKYNSGPSILSAHFHSDEISTFCPILRTMTQAIKKRNTESTRPDRTMGRGNTKSLQTVAPSQTIVTLVPRDNPGPVIDGRTKDAAAVVGVLSVTVGVVAIPIASMRQGVSMALLRMSQCQEDTLNGDPLEVAVHPFRFPLGNGKSKYGRGAVVGNLLVIPTFWGVMCYFFIPLLIRRIKGLTLPQARDAVGWPGVALLPFTVVCEGSAMASVGLVSTGDVGDVILGCVGLIVIMLTVIGWASVLWKVKPNVKSKRVPRERIMKMVEPRSEWELSVDNKAAAPLDLLTFLGEQSSIGYLEKRISLIGSSWWLWSAVAAHSLSMVVGIAEGLPTSHGNCRIRWIIAVVASLLQAAVVMTNTVPIELLLLGVLGLLNCALACVISLSTFGVWDPEDASDVLNGVGLASSITGIILLGIGALTATFDAYSQWRKGQVASTTEDEGLSLQMLTEMDIISTPTTSSSVTSNAHAPVTVTENIETISQPDQSSIWLSILDEADKAADAARAMRREKAMR